LREHLDELNVKKGSMCYCIKSQIESFRSHSLDLFYFVHKLQHILPRQDNMFGQEMKWKVSVLFSAPDGLSNGRFCCLRL